MIINCHIHLFTQKSVPSGFPPFPLNYLSRTGLTRGPLVWLMRTLWPFSSRDILHRYANFMAIAAYKSQEQILKEVQGRYPLDTKFIVLPMDLRGMRRGKIKQDITTQHEELKDLAEKYRKQIIPFIHIDPRSETKFSGPNPVEFIKKFHAVGFKGIKLYPPLGYDVTDDLLTPIYEYANENNLPVMTHCSMGGVKDKTLKPKQIAKMIAPHKYRTILEKYKNLRLCLAHFGGGDDWERYLKDAWHDQNKPIEAMNWLSQISTLIRSGDYPNLFTDISYTIFNFERYVPILKVFLEDEKIQNRTLFGSDYYMIEQKKFKERELSMRLRSELGPELFSLIAETNPKIYLEGSKD